MLCSDEPALYADLGDSYTNLNTIKFRRTTLRNCARDIVNFNINFLALTISYDYIRYYHWEKLVERHTGTLLFLHFLVSFRLF